MQLQIYLRVVQILMEILNSQERKFLVKKTRQDIVLASFLFSELCQMFEELFHPIKGHKAHLLKDKEPAEE